MNFQNALPKTSAAHPQILWNVWVFFSFRKIQKYFENKNPHTLVYCMKKGVSLMIVIADGGWRS